MLRVLFASLFIGAVVAYPSQNAETNLTVYKDPETGFRYFWYPAEKGGYVKAFLEGGPPPVTNATNEDVHFFLYTKTAQNPVELSVGCVNCLEDSMFDRNAPVKFVCHGFMSDYQSNINVLMREGYYRSSQYMNVIVVNWENLAAAPWYETAALNTKPVGAHVGVFVDFLVNSGYTTYSKVHFSGHSLGSHVGGYTGAHTLQKIARITGLDPALPLFGERPDSERLDPSDADFVDVIHTSGGSLAFQDPRGHVDFYPNNGQAYQPGCSVDLIHTCSHSRAYEFMSESVWHTNGFPSYKCNSWADYDAGRCSMTEMTQQGEYASPSARGNYFLRTNQNPPFGQG